MQVLSSVAETRSAVERPGRRDRVLGLVPTMGNLHDGHLALVRACRARCDEIAVSIYVNPAQFAPHEDLDSYPRTLKADLAALEAEGVDYVFTPDDRAIYPGAPEEPTRVEVPELSSILCGASRPTFFRGVTTVVAKLFNIVRPDVAMFGEKDYQQLVVVRRMVRDLHLPVEVAAVPTVRAADGLAMSSRNRYLKDHERRGASALYQALQAAVESLRSGERDLRAVGLAGMQRLERAGFRPDYFSVRRALDLASPGPEDVDLRVLAAGWLGMARLIDNVAVTLPSSDRQTFR